MPEPTRENGDLRPTEADPRPTEADPRLTEVDLLDDEDARLPVEPFEEDLAPVESGGRRRGRRRKWRDVTDLRPTKPPREADIDVYSTKKTVSQGFMDVALLSANADQLRSLVTKGDASSPFHTVCIVFLSLSIVLQVVIAICLMLKGRYNINRPSHFRAAEVVNNVCMVASVLLTACNVLAAAFTTEVPPMVAAAAGGAASAEVLQGAIG